MQSNNIMNLFRTRRCPSPDETFHLESNQCLKIGSRGSNVCSSPEEMLYDGLGNVGVCDCVQDERELVYLSGHCYQLNTQVQIKLNE